MKNQFSRIAAIGFAALLAAAPAGAQSVQMRFNVPFAFLAGGQMHSAGHYVIRLDPAFHAMDLRPSSGGSLERLPLEAAPVARREDIAMPGVLKFRKYGAVFALQGVWATDQRDGYAPQPSRAEEALAQAGAGATVEVAAVSLR